MDINVYCDESCHLLKDGQSSMVLGAISCPRDQVKDVAIRLRDLRSRHNLAADLEIKWTKVSPARLDFYLDVIDYFFDTSHLSFRALVVPDKTNLDHGRFAQDHSTWYYKMYFDMLKILFSSENRYAIYIDIKDTRGADRVRKLWEVLCNEIGDGGQKIIHRIQQARSHELELMQMADLLIGAVSFRNRHAKDAGSEAKRKLVERIAQRSGYDLTHSSLYGEKKFNLFKWQAR